MAYARSNEAEGRYLQLTVWEKSCSIANNTSLVGWKLESTGGESVYYMIAPTTVVVDNTTVYSKGKTEWTDRVFPAAKGSVSGELTVVHDAEGKKNITFSLSTRVYVSSTPMTWTGSLTLTELPRGVTVDFLTCSTAYFDGALTVKYTPKNAEYHNRCIISLGNTGVKRIDLGKKAAAQQTQVLSLTESELATVYDLLPKTSVGTLRVSISTYYDSAYVSQVGSTSYKDIELTIPTSVEPTAILSVELQNSDPWINSLGICVRNHTALSIGITGSPGDGAMIAALGITCGGYSTSQSKLTIAKITDSGVLGISGKVTDTRARSTADTKEITVYPYNVPSISYIASERGTYSNGWISDENGDDLRVLFKSVLSLAEQGNTYTAAFNIDGSTVTSAITPASEFVDGVDNEVYITGVEKELIHALTLTVTDKVGNSRAATITVPSVVIPMEFKSNGKGVSLGKPSKKDGFECAFPSDFYKGMSLSVDGESDPEPITDTVIEQGTNGIWTWRKWYSGIAECWGSLTVKTDVLTAWGSLYTSGVISSADASFPFEFVQAPTVNVSLTNCGTGGFLMVSGMENNPVSKTGVGSFEIVRGTAITDADFKINYTVKGKWK